MTTTIRPLIGYPTRSGIITSDSAAPRFANNESYAYAIADAGGAPVMIPSIPDDDALGAIYASLDGLLLSGGPDVDPARYGQERHPLTDEGDARMEHAEIYLIRRALEDELPILGICRGCQALNVVAGGTLYQDVGDEARTTIPHADYLHARDHLGHTARLERDSRLGRIIGRAETPVNSLHHQSVRELAPGFAATATAPDGLVEAIERPGLPFVMAVQWHPEELYRKDGRQAAIFRAFVEAAAGYRRRRARP